MPPLLFVETLDATLEVIMCHFCLCQFFLLIKAITDKKKDISVIVYTHVSNMLFSILKSSPYQFDLEKEC